MMNYKNIDAKKYARIAGILYLVLFFTGPFSFFYVPSVIVAPGDAAATLSNIQQHEQIFRWGILSESSIFITEIILSVLLFVLLRPVNFSIALMAMIARLMQSTIQGANLFTSFAALNLSGESTGLGIEQVQALLMQTLHLHNSGILISQFFFGFHCLLLGILLYKAGYFPRVLGIMIFIASIGYLIDSYGNLLAPQYKDVYSMIVLLPAIVSELSLTLWLLIKGVNVEKWNEMNKG